MSKKLSNGTLVTYRHSDGKEYPAAVTEVFSEGMVSLRVALPDGHKEVTSVAVDDSDKPGERTFKPPVDEDSNAPKYSEHYLARYAKGNP